MVFQYLYTVDADDGDSEYRGDDAFSIHILEIQMVIVQYSHTKDVDDDVLTNPLCRIKFEYFRDKLGVVRKDLPRKGEQ